MGKFLRSVGNAAYRHKWLVIAGWIVILVILGLLAKHYYKQPSSAVSIPGTSAQKALDRFSELFPSAGKGTGRVVFEAENGETITQHRSDIEAVVAQISKVEGVRQVTDPFAVAGSISKDDTVAYATVSLTEEAVAVKESTITDISKITDGAQSKDFAAYRGGDIISRVPSEILGPGEITGVVLALIVLLVMLGSLVAAGLPIIVAIVTVISGAAGLFALSQVVNITSTTPVLAVMLGLAVGIDYSLFIVNKYRHYLLAGYDYEAATSRALSTAGKAVLFAAATVVIALSALSVVGIPFMTSMGLAAAGTVAIAALVATTLLPALFGIVGSRIFTHSTRRKIIAAQKRGPHESHQVARGVFWRKVAGFVTDHPMMVVLFGIVVAGIIALPIRSLTLGLPTDEFAASNTSQRHAYDALKRGFGAGFNAPLIVVAENVPAVTDADRQAARAQLTAIYDQRVAEATAAQTQLFQKQMATAKTYAQKQQVQKQIAAAQAAGLQQEQQARLQLETQIEQYSVRYELAKISNAIAARSDVQSATPLLVTGDTTKGMIQVIPKAGPADESTKALISDLRNSATVENLADNANTSFAVTGSAALQMDINNKLASVLPTYLMLVIGLSFVLLVLVFRSILVPLKATLGFLLSVGAMFGAMVAVFQWGWFGISAAPGPIVSSLPIIAIGVLFGLAMDYEFFLVSSIHEEYERTRDPQEAVINGYTIGSRVVFAAAVIMVSVFAGFISNKDQVIQSIGFGLAVGIFVDAFIVRLLIVPAIMSLIGRAAWWMPKRLERVLPHIDIEGK